MKFETAALRIRSSVATLGLTHTFHDLALKATNRVVPLKVLKCMSIERVHPAFATCPEPYRPMFLDKPMLREFSRDPANDMSEGFLEEALAKEDECFGILAGDSLAAYGWYSSGPTRIDPPGLALQPGGGYVYMYKGFTHPGHRGRRLHAIGMTMALQEYLKRSFKGLVSCVESNDFSSLNSVHRMGYGIFGTIYVLRPFGVTVTHASAGCRARGVRVRPVRPAARPRVGALAGHGRP